MSEEPGLYYTYGIASYDIDGKFRGYECVICFKLSQEMSQQWDSYVCLDCGVWLEPICGCTDEDDCCYAGRPPKPEIITTPFGKLVE